MIPQINNIGVNASLKLNCYISSTTTFMTAASFYHTRLQQLQQLQQQLVKLKNIFAFIRFACMVGIGLTAWLLWPLGWYYATGLMVVLLFVFVRVVYRDIANRWKIKNTLTLIQLNENEVKALQHDFKSFNNGNEYTPKDHYYANDMDIFGSSSLFQFTNRTVSAMGGERLANWLLHPAKVTEIAARQEAVKDLRNNMVWCQELQAFGKENPIQLRTRDQLSNWVKEPVSLSHVAVWKWLRYVLPAISISVTVLVIFSYLPMSALYANIFVMSLIAASQEKKVQYMHQQLSNKVEELASLEQSIAHVERAAFNAPLLQSLQQDFANEAMPASTGVARLKKILDRMDLRFNLVLVVPLNVLLLWNIQQALSLEKWKTAYDQRVKKWFNSLGDWEALCSFAVMHFNHAEWVFPSIVPEHFYIKATNLGHPLIAPDKRVNNEIDIEQKAAVMLVTGSNMAGKSTYLRSIGINIILAMAGAPVCAKTFECSAVQLMSSMRVADNLEESTSTFYAELKKLKTIIEKVNENAPVFVLLDEILRGTNSLDRHTGSKALIKQLISKEAAAVLATHDVDLAALQTEFPSHIFNYHFDVQVNGEELYFDYKLKPGVCKSLNASILMKKIGIEI